MIDYNFWLDFKGYTFEIQITDYTPAEKGIIHSASLEPLAPMEFEAILLTILEEEETIADAIAQGESELDVEDYTSVTNEELYNEIEEHIFKMEEEDESTF